MFNIRSLALKGLYLSYESMATFAYRLLRLPRLRTLDLSENLFDETTATNAVFMLRVRCVLLFRPPVHITQQITSITTLRLHRGIQRWSSSSWDSPRSLHAQWK